VSITWKAWNQMVQTMYMQGGIFGQVLNNYSKKI